ncbi:alpha-L-rhamnosidase-related protein [Niabella ginsengisoli]|uniref:Alpha-rhamnosidase n=1 Tax=Niabella ginsengisoli TaxID=522298 RepID=A0ABS9SHN2_9BACT|nr:amylo-alpha-1,6-glucosidase [Niabella ginsengisoli]MCH5597840.1 alpha-rhamnosidase [Niabella ginsengisoli]
MKSTFEYMESSLRRTLVHLNIYKQKKLRTFLVLLFSFWGLTGFAQTWIWYPGDYEIWLSNQMQNRRTERGTFFPVFWKIDNHYPLIDFHKVFDLSTPEEVDIYVDGQYNVKLDGKAFEGSPKKITVPAGKHKINIKVFNQKQVPTIFVKGNKVVSDSSWLVTYEDKEWIDETGKTSDVSTTKWMNAGSWNFNNSDQLPANFMLPTKPMEAASINKTNDGTIVDFGKETFGYIKLHNLKGKGKLAIYYGESREEAIDTAHTETYDKISVDQQSGDYTVELSKAFRFVKIIADPAVTFDKVSMLYEYADLQDKGSFKCNDEEINRIYDVAKYTFHLSTKEFFIDGIKRDRWIWSGDAYQSYLMNYYLTNDNGTVKRTTLALRGKDPVTSHINTIMDYTLYWFLGVYDYYLYSGDADFVRSNYDRMKSMMSYVLGRRNKDGLLEGLPGDWVFIDWAEGLSKQGAVSFEQLLFARSLETMALVADLVEEKEDVGMYTKLAADVKKKLFEIYWNEQKQAIVHSYVNGKPTDNVTRYANMFAIFFDYLNDKQKNNIKNSVLLNNDVPPITTPYMRFYEMEAMCALGEQEYVTKEMKSYWGGMLKLGATSFWEEYNPKKSGAEHYAMYGRKYGKSLCHAWGASPLYLLGKYYLGVKPTGAGYSTYTIEPALGGLKWMEGKVPTPAGNIELYCSTTNLKIKAPTGTGTLMLKSKKAPVCKEGNFVNKGNDLYELTIEKNKDYDIKYQAL